MNIPDTTPPNAGCYSKKEEREGPPLAYISEKIRSSLFGLHAFLASGQPCYKLTLNTDAAPYWFGATEAFRNMLKSYLCLNNLAGLWTNDLQEKLMAMKSKDFNRWLSDVEREGSVT